MTSGNFCGASDQYTVHFDMKFNQPITGYGTWTELLGAPGREVA